MTVRFSNQLVADLIQPFWAAWQAGEFMTDADRFTGRRQPGGRSAYGTRPAGRANS